MTKEETPLFSYARHEQRTEFGLHPLFYLLSDTETGSLEWDVLFPLVTYRRGPDAARFQFLQLISYERGPSAHGGLETAYFFLLLGGRTTSEEGLTSFALFPLYGRLREALGRDEINFVLFPLYAYTRTGEVETRHVLWPVFYTYHGPGEWGVKLWPLYGHSEKEGVHSKTFALWPLFFSQDVNLDTKNPRHVLILWPLYASFRTPERTSTAYLWPFISHTVVQKGSYSQWDLPWPLISIGRGEDREVVRLFPLYGRTVREGEKRSFVLWPLYISQEEESEEGRRTRDRVLFYLYSRTKEKRSSEENPSSRLDMWPLFSYTKNSQGGVRFSTLSLLEPFFPFNQKIERNYSPLWRIYRYERDAEGGKHVSFLWNLVDYRRGAERKSLRLFYLPWRFSWSAGGEKPVSEDDRGE